MERAARPDVPNEPDPAPLARPARGWRAGVAAGLAAGLTSWLAMAWRGRRDAGAATIALNAPSHWLYGPRAVNQRGVSWRYTAPAVLIHFGSAVFWGVLHAHRRTGPAHPVRDAAASTATAAFVDLALTPRRLRPGFDQRLSPSGLAWVYGAFALGLLLSDRARARGRGPASGG